MPSTVSTIIIQSSCSLELLAPRNVNTLRVNLVEFMYLISVITKTKRLLEFSQSEPTTDSAA